MQLDHALIVVGRSMHFVFIDELLVCWDDAEKAIYLNWRETRSVADALYFLFNPF